jgi:ubiquinol-cytochrome c reductase cytochrome c subunit
MLLAIAGVTALVVVMCTGTNGRALASRATPGIRTMFLADCAVCHGADARGTARGPTLERAGRAGVDYWVSTGRMPLSSPDATPQRHEPRYSPKQVRAIVDYVVTLTRNASPRIPNVDLSRASLSEGATQFQLNCAACHSSTGVGGALFERAAPPVLPATAIQAAEAIRIGPGQMPAFGKAALDARRLNDTVAYVKYLSHPRDRGGWALGHIGPLAEGAAIMIFGLGTLLLVTRWIGTRT